ncbi:MAG: oligosaccharide flippase family protein [Prevotella sp.]|nr:oligosaccharide flippase family protein [Prevotella sp.]MDY4626436.1 oligosaccharide flippase family protein [Prevotella sp.]MDY4666952.1 oligosaccharide flippase family protein [Prevotella sp.]MDY5259021.1 oligosaccharide flippase family protein [Prevotella sp.]
MSNLKTEPLHGVKWSAIGRFANTGISFGFGIVLARLLSPSDFGVMGMIAIFFAIAGIFIDSGFGMALVQKKSKHGSSFIKKENDN